MAKSATVKKELDITGVSSKGNLVTLSLSSGAVEIPRASHKDLKKIGAGVKVEVELKESDVKKLESGNTVPASFVGIVVEQAAAAPRTSDSRNS